MKCPKTGQYSGDSWKPDWQGNYLGTVIQVIGTIWIPGTNKNSFQMFPYFRYQYLHPHQASANNSTGDRYLSKTCPLENKSQARNLDSCEDDLWFSLSSFDSTQVSEV